MGRKHAPQPLALSEPAVLGDSQSAAAETLTVPSPASPVSSKSPKSPRSPFRFGQKKPSPSLGTNPLPAGKAQSQSSSPQYPSQAQAQAQAKVQAKAQSKAQEQGREREQEQATATQSRTSIEVQQQYQPIDEAIHKSLVNTPSSPNSNFGTTIPVTPAPALAPAPATTTTAITSTVPVISQSIPETSGVSHQQQQHQNPPEEEGSVVGPVGKSTKSGGGRFFHFSKSSRPSHPQQSSTPHNNNGRHMSSPGVSLTSATVAAVPRGENMSKDSDRPAVPIPTSSSKSTKHSDRSLQKPIPSHQQNSSKSDLSLVSTGENDAVTSAASTPGKRGKPKPFALMNRTKSNRDKDTPSPQDGVAAPAPAPTRLADSERPQNPLRTAPIGHERSFREMMNSAARNRSEDRGGAQTRDTSLHREEKNSRTQPSSFKENSGSNFLTNLRNSSRTAADMFSKGIFGKNVRSGSTNEKEPFVDDEHYQLKVINLPLIEQARLTRISKRLEDSRDKTEFWMPAFPWRAIDYLNYNGCDVEGLYRVPGSGTQVKKWQRKFDEEYDVDLFAQDDLYDINIVGSMLKAWLRELPDELFPKEAQERISRECAGAESVPELLIEELSSLPPFHYYLLFAITCHLSLLLAHSDKNKMDFRNLCICFQPCMKIDAFCFKFLVCDWRDCWKGCKNEAKYIEEEYTLFDQPPPPSIGTEPRKKKKRQDNNSAVDEWAVSSSDSKQSVVMPENNQKGRLKKKPVPQSESNGTVASHSTISTALTINSERETPARKGELTLRPLSPIKPLSPLGF